MESEKLSQAVADLSSPGLRSDEGYKEKGERENWFRRSVTKHSLSWVLTGKQKWVLPSL